jgi:hypothetical protein
VGSLRLRKAAQGKADTPAQQKSGREFGFLEEEEKIYYKNIISNDTAFIMTDL